MKRLRGFTLVELLVTISIIAVLATLSLSALSKVRSIAQGAHCSNSLRQLGVATTLYLGDNNRTYFAYSTNTDEGRLWYFGFESWGSLGGSEGDRDLDQTKAPLYPYVQSVGGVEVCPAFPYESALWKPKFKGASWGYGYNVFLSSVNAFSIERPSRTVLFGDCAQINTFQAPASAKKPMLEEFYMIESNYKTVHFRHGAVANLLFADGHVEGLQVYPGTEDTRIPTTKVGRISPVGSLQYLR